LFGCDDLCRVVRCGERVIVVRTQAGGRSDSWKVARCLPDRSGRRPGRPPRLASEIVSNADRDAAYTERPRTPSTRMFWPVMYPDSGS